MSLTLTAGDLTIHRLIEQETTFLPAQDLFPGLTADQRAAGKRPMGADVPQGALRLRQARIRLLDGAARQGRGVAFGDSVLPIVEARKADIVGHGFSIGDHARLLPTPGHTPGHVAFTFGRGKDDVVFSGDLMHSPLQTRYPDLAPKFDDDPVQAVATSGSSQ